LYNKLGSENIFVFFFGSKEFFLYLTRQAEQHEEDCPGTVKILIFFSVRVNFFTALGCFIECLNRIHILIIYYVHHVIDAFFIVSIAFTIPVIDDGRQGRIK